MDRPSFTIEHTGKKSARAVIEAGTGDWEMDLLLRSDAHHDNPLADTKLEKYHLDLALKRGALITDNGDCFCAMQGPHDPRQDKEQLRDRDKRNDYFDGLVEEHTEFYRPYADNWLWLNKGNHEKSVLTHHGTDLTKRLGSNLQSIAKGPGPVVMPYTGWITLQFKYRTTHTQSFVIFYTHGYGGGGPVTKDLIQLNRQLAYIENADFFLSGHTHDKWVVPVRRERVDEHGAMFERTVTAIKIGGYKNETDAGDGWAACQGRPPRPPAGWWIKFRYERGRIRHYTRDVEELD